MNVDETTVRNLCTDAVFERGRNYREDGRIQRLDRFGDRISATVQGSTLYDVTVDIAEPPIDARCTCPYRGDGECKHVVAVLLDVAADPPSDESARVDAVLEDVPAGDLRSFLRDALAAHPELRDRFLTRHGDAHKSLDDYRDEIEALFDQHTREYPVVTDAIDFSHFFDLAEQYRERERYRAAAAVYRALFEGIDDNEVRIDAAYDHYAKVLRSALDGYVACVLTLDPAPDEFEQYAGILEAQASSGPGVNSEQFRRALDDLDDRR